MFIPRWKYPTMTGRYLKIISWLPKNCNEHTRIIEDLRGSSQQLSKNVSYNSKNLEVVRSRIEGLPKIILILEKITRPPCDTEHNTNALAICPLYTRQQTQYSNRFNIPILRLSMVASYRVNRRKKTCSSRLQYRIIFVRVSVVQTKWQLTKSSYMYYING